MPSPSLAVPVVAAAQAPPAPEPVPDITLPPVEVVAPSPLPGVRIDRDKIPGTARSVGAEDFARTASPYVTDTLFQRIPDISLSDPNGNTATQELSYRGFAASPLQGAPQGLAVYMSGDPPQRGVRRHRQLGPDPDQRDQRAAMCGPTIRCSG